MHRPSRADLGICARPNRFASLPVSPLARAIRAAGAVILLATLAGCHFMPRTVPAPAEPRHAELAAFKAVLSAREAASSATSPSDELVAVLNRDTGLLRWKLAYAGLSGRVRSAHFDKPAQNGKTAAPVLSIGRNLRRPCEGRAMLTPRQRDDLLAGLWYLSLGAARFPESELRGQMIEQR